MELPSITASSYCSSSTAWDGRNGLNVAGRIFSTIAQPTPTNLIAAILDNPKEQKMTARFVKVFIADTNDNLPLAKQILYAGEEKLTDLTDQELFFETPISELLAKHNAVRAATVDKKQSEKFGRDIFLESARIRDLKMVVVTIASF